MKYKFNSDEFLQLIKDGKIEKLKNEELEIFAKIIPR